MTRVCDEGEVTAANLELCFVGTIEIGEQTSLVAGIFVKTIDIDAKQPAGVEGRQVSLDIGFRSPEHVEQPLIDINNIMIGIRHHHRDVRSVQGKLDPGGIGPLFGKG